MPSTPLVSFITAVGLLTLPVAPVPSCPKRPLPQQNPAPFTTAQVWLPVADTDVTGPNFWMATGCASPIVVPNPSCPESPRPQHQSSPPSAMAQACSAPTA